MDFVISQIMFFTYPKLAVFLSLVAVLLYLLRNWIGKKFVYGIIVLIVGIILLGIDKILEMVFGAVAGALIFSHIQEIIKKRVEREYESKHSK